MHTATPGAATDRLGIANSRLMPAAATNSETFELFIWLLGWNFTTVWKIEHSQTK